MKSTYPKYSKESQLGEIGVNLVSKIINDEFKWLFKRNPQEYDFGIDASIDIITDENFLTGQTILMQIKHGSSFFQQKNRWGYVYRGEMKHYDYLSNQAVPVLIVICHLNDGKCYWQKFSPEEAELTSSAWKMTIPFKNVLSETKSEVLKLLPLSLEYSKILKNYHDTNKIIKKCNYIHFVIKKSEIFAMNTSKPREFLDRLKKTKELAYHCQGKVEFSIDGYEEDKRELYEIEEVRAYIKKLDKVLFDILFFINISSEKKYAIYLFILCQIDVKLLGKSKSGLINYIDIKVEQNLDFFQRHLDGLNSTTEWLNMTDEENKKIFHSIMDRLQLSPN